jgi:hypothetical protein
MVRVWDKKTAEPNLLILLVFSILANLKEKSKPLTPKAVTRLYTVNYTNDPPDEQQEVECDLKNLNC